MCNFEISRRSIEFIKNNRCPNCGCLLTETYDGKECSGICGFSISHVTYYSMADSFTNIGDDDES